MDARRLKPVMAKRACAVGERERHDNEITSLNRSNVCADVFDHTYRFVPHHATGLAVLHFLIWPQIASANARSGNANESISRLDDFRVRHVLDPDIASAIHQSCAHNDWLRNLLSLRFQRSHVDREAVLHIRLKQSLVRFVDLLNGNDFDVGGDVVFAAEIKHLLRLCDSANGRTGKTASSHDQAKRRDVEWLCRSTDQRKVSVNAE